MRAELDNPSPHRGGEPFSIPWFRIFLIGPGIGHRPQRLRHHLVAGGQCRRGLWLTIDAYGLGARSFTVGSDGAAFGVSDKTTLNVYQLLKAVNQRAVGGVLYNGEKMLRREAADLPLSFRAARSRLPAPCR